MNEKSEEEENGKREENQILLLLRIKVVSWYLVPLMEAY